MAVVNKELIENYKAIHKSKKYGQNANDFMLHCLVCIFDLNAKKVLEYGCGQSVLYKKFENFGIEWQRFDPSIEGIDILPSGQDFDLCVNTDVLEHIPEEDIGDVLKKIKSYSEKVFFSISTRPARQILSNGQNAHCTVWKAEKWLRKIKDFFPESILVNNRFDEQCIIITWNSSATEILQNIEKMYRDAKYVKQDTKLKKLERRFRKVRDIIFKKI